MTVDQETKQTLERLHKELKLDEEVSAAGALLTAQLGTIFILMIQISGKREIQR